MDWDAILPIIIATAVSIIAAIVTLVVGNRRGLPDIEAEIDRRKGELVDTLQDQLNVMERDFKACKTSLVETKRENEQLWRRVRLTEMELLDLYRATGQKPPVRLTQADNGDMKDA